MPGVWPEAIARRPPRRAPAPKGGRTETGLKRKGSVAEVSGDLCHAFGLSDEERASMVTVSALEAFGGIDGEFGVVIRGHGVAV